MPSIKKKSGSSQKKAGSTKKGSGSAKAPSTRALSSYNMYMKSHTSDFQQGEKAPVVMKRLVTKWKALDESKKAKFQKKADKYNEEHSLGAKYNKKKPAAGKGGRGKKEKQIIISESESDSSSESESESDSDSDSGSSSSDEE